MLDGAGANGPLVIAHRGASSEIADNSLEAFDAVIALGVDMIEFDVRRTKDDRLIAFHDPDIGGIPIRELTREQIGQRLERVPPLLSEVLDLSRGRTMLDVELKEDGYVDRVLEALTDGFDPEQLIITSFLDEVVRQAKLARPQITAGLLIGASRPANIVRARIAGTFPVDRAKRCDADCVAVHFMLAGYGALRRIAAAGYPALVWTVNEDKRLRALLSDERVAGVITDVPANALAIREQLGPRDGAGANGTPEGR
jgi:glycerophosphoryl diester phosphodiesterase